MSERRVVSYKVLVGMEIHVQLATKSKMFTGAANGFGGEPNAQVDPVILGLPGVLPVMNKKAVESAIKVGLALGCRIASHTKWDRKSYYYPDLPKNYQISQYDLPLCAEGSFDLSLKDGTVRTVRIRRAHLEEDAGKLMHEAPGGYPIDWSIVDLNRAGTPLLEIVTEPDLSSGTEVAQFGQELQKLVQFLGVSEAQMQMGHMRFEPNINVHITDGDGVVHKTAITEIKNLNSFSVLQRATDFEVQRQINEWIDTGKPGRKNTFGWDESTESTFFQRFKEGESDYRYFPDPDLVPVEVSDGWLTELKSQVGELPAARRARYIDQIGLTPADAATLAGDRATGDFYEAAVATGADPKRVGNLVINSLATLANKAAKPVSTLGISPQRVGEVAKLIDANTVAASTALPIFESLLEADAPAEAVATKLGLMQVSDTGAIDAAIDAMLATNPKSLQDYKGGKQAALGGLVGMVMKSGKGLNAKLVQERLKAKIADLSENFQSLSIGTLLILPVDRLTVSDIDPINGKWQVGDVTFYSKAGLERDLSSMGVREPLSQSVNDMAIGDFTTFAIFKSLGEIDKLRQTVFESAREAVHILAASVAYYYPEKDFAFNLHGYPTHGTKQVASIDLLTKRFNRSRAVRGKLMAVTLDEKWLHFNKMIGVDKLFERIADDTLENNWRRQIRSSAAMLGRSFLSLEPFEAFIHNVIGLETLLTNRSERNGDILSERAFKLLSWCSSNRNYINDIKNIHAVRCAIVHDGDYRGLSHELVYLSQHYHKFILLNVIKNPTKFGSKDQLTRSLDSVSNASAWKGDATWDLTWADPDSDFLKYEDNSLW